MDTNDPGWDTSEPSSLPQARRSDQLRREIESEILSGRLAPGARLDEQALAERFTVSRTPVREALRALAADGLVENRPRQGTVVSILSMTQLLEMFEVMAGLEGFCAQIATRRMTPEQRDAILARHELCGRMMQDSDVDAYYEANRELHESIYAATGNRFLEEQTRRTRNRLSPYRRYQLYQTGRLQRSNHEHGSIIEAMLDGESDKAEALMRRHINIQSDTFLDFISALPFETRT